MIPIWTISNPADAERLRNRLRRLRLSLADCALSRGDIAAKDAAVRQIIADVADRGDAAVVDWAQRYDDPDFSADQVRVSPDEMAAASARVDRGLLDAVRLAIRQVTNYQRHFIPEAIEEFVRGGTRLGMRFTPMDSAGCYFPGGKAAYPSSLIHLAVPAIVAGVRKVVVVSPPSKFGRSDVVLAACAELELTHVYRAGGAAAIAALALGTETIPAVDKIVGPGNDYVQLAKRAVSGAVGVDGYLGPSEILTIADDTGRADFIAADLIAQAEHDPGSCFLVTTSAKLATAVAREIAAQVQTRDRRPAIERSLVGDSAVIVADSFAQMMEIANEIAAEHVNVQCADNEAVLEQLRHAGACFVGPYSAVAAGDYVAGPSHCLPTNTTARFSSGISVYEFLKRSSVVRYDPAGAAADSEAVIRLATEEHLDGHAASVRLRVDGGDQS